MMLDMMFSHVCRGSYSAADLVFHCSVSGCHVVDVCISVIP